MQKNEKALNGEKISTIDITSELEQELNELENISELAKSNKSELPEKYINFSYSSYKLNGLYKLMFKLEKKKLNGSSYSRELDYKSELISEKMLKELKASEQDGYKLVFNNSISELAYRKSELEKLASELKSEKSEQEKSELEKQASELIQAVRSLKEKSEQELNELKTELSEKNKNA